MSEHIEALERRVTELEIKVGLADDTIDNLNQALFRQQQQMDVLLRELGNLRRLLEDGPGDLAGPANERPPHY